MKTSTVTTAVLLAVILVGAAAVGLYLQPSDDEPVMTEVLNEDMNIIGLTDGKVTSFKGIPFAEAPVGDLRFAPPVPKAPWTDTLDCTEFRASAIQSPDEDVPVVSEDCLFLNVWAPADAKAGDKLPVYVWIHGGAFMNGSGSMDYYGGEVFAQEDIVVVTINYRLGMLGYLYMDTLLEKYGTAGNFATLDQIMALRWVQEHIGAFGGDAGNVTVGGESAGSVSVCNLLICKEAEGLFHKAIMESGTIVNSFMPIIAGNPEKSLEMTGDLLEILGLEDNEEGLAGLRQMDPLTLWSFSSKPSSALTDKPYAFMPIYDGGLLPADPGKAFADGDYNRDVKVLVGSNAREGDVFAGDIECEKDWEKFVYHTWKGDDARAVIDHYKDDERSVQEIHAEIVGLTFFNIPVAQVEDSLARNGSTVYAYEFDHESSNGLPPVHASEICYAFGTPHKIVKSPSDSDRKVATQMNLMWANFIRNGDPNTGAPLPDDVEWLPYDCEDPKVMHIDTHSSFGGKRYASEIAELSPHYHL